jgi:hypothetical protein
MKNNLFLNERNINLIVKIVYIIDNSKRFILIYVARNKRLSRYGKIIFQLTVVPEDKQ